MELYAVVLNAYQVKHNYTRNQFREQLKSNDASLKDLKTFNLSIF